MQVTLKRASVSMSKESGKYEEYCGRHSVMSREVFLNPTALGVEDATRRRHCVRFRIGRRETVFSGLAPSQLER